MSLLAERSMKTMKTLWKGNAMDIGDAAPSEVRATGLDRLKLPRPTAQKKILLVDDSATVLLMERSLLSRTYQVITATDGQEGVERALAEKPDLILMDVMMPRMGGIEAVRQLRSEAGTKDIPVIMVTTRGELDNVETGYRSGCNDYVTKPFSGVELLAKVKNCLGE
jgi:DNA-binding response OmpR family regulator